MQGAGNDYIYVNDMKYGIENPSEVAVRWSAPHSGIGADGLVLIGASTRGDFSMRIFNADGSEALMCGNAVRCVGKYVYDNKLTEKVNICLETRSGMREMHLKIREGQVEEVEVDMGTPLIGCGDVTLVVGDGVGYKGTIVSMGNPHFVMFVDDITSFDLNAAGPLLEHHSMFPDRTNVEVAQVLKEDTIRMRVWERGSGITQACGTGACATAVAAAAKGLAKPDVCVEMDGGSLAIRWAMPGAVWMTGLAVKVFDGVIRR